ncbi:hypothetical protein FVF58_43855 [Paraburkholderia panacisoli]|uniref:Uncharacterized protein n=1 Tax=Paraburkholderia panacisoli TaxID=2603818 RepID=A0A5B0G7H6_9BURK|nr:hypothetical protein [Paraburkholderia panacisoli]KAA0998655.1 hypothetical protein FVF58_43855 [Paraburkholderia panacisoli]
MTTRKELVRISECHRASRFMSPSKTSVSWILSRWFEPGIASLRDKLLDEHSSDDLASPEVGVLTRAELIDRARPLALLVSLRAPATGGEAQNTKIWYYDFIARRSPS